MVQQSLRNNPEDDLDRLIRMREEIKTLEVRQTELCGNMALPDKIKALKTELQDLALERLSRKADLEQLHDKQKEDMTEKIKSEMTSSIEKNKNLFIRTKNLDLEIVKKLEEKNGREEELLGLFEEKDILVGTIVELESRGRVLKEDTEVVRKTIDEEMKKFLKIKKDGMAELICREHAVTDRGNKVERWEREFTASEKIARDEINGLRSAHTIERDDFIKKRSIAQSEISKAKDFLGNLRREQAAKEESLDRKDQNLAINEKKLTDWEKTLGKREQDLKTNQEAFAKKAMEIKWEKDRA